MQRRIDRDSLGRYFSQRLGECRVKGIKRLGSGAHGTGFLVKVETPGGGEEFVLKGITPEGLGHDYPSDRAAMHLLALESFGSLPGHVKALDVLSVDRDGVVKSIGGGAEYFLLMEHAEGTSYFKDLEELAGKGRLDEADRLRIAALAEYLAGIHSVKKVLRQLYLRKLRDVIGHGECLMGVFDMYPEGVLDYGEMADVEKKCIDWRARLKHKCHRLSQIHGDFHPGNIWFTGPQSFRLLDRSRGPWGEPADDVTALTINYVFFSIKRLNALGGACGEGLELFFKEYLERTGDREVLEVLAPFYAFRGAVVANPVFYPELSPGQRRLIFKFVHNVLAAGRFDPERAGDYVG
jgi:hypothetical protein